MERKSASVSRASSSKRTSKESKGNVIVSVRVRPDPSGNDSNRAEGEWLVDGRSALVAYKGREGGDHYYGKLCGYLSIVARYDADYTEMYKITYSHLTMTTHACTTLLLSDWYVE